MKLALLPQTGTRETNDEAARQADIYIEDRSKISDGSGNNKQTRQRYVNKCLSSWEWIDVSVTNDGEVEAAYHSWIEEQMQAWCTAGGHGPTATITAPACTPSNYLFRPAGFALMTQS